MYTYTRNVNEEQLYKINQLRKPWWCMFSYEME